MVLMTLLSLRFLFLVSILHSSQNTSESLLLGSECVLKHLSITNDKAYLEADGVAADESERVLQVLQTREAGKGGVDAVHALLHLGDGVQDAFLHALHLLRQLLGGVCLGRELGYLLDKDFNFSFGLSELDGEFVAVLVLGLELLFQFYGCYG